MNFPVAALSQEPSLGESLGVTALAGALVLGTAFGFVLERSGFGRAQILVAQFYGTKMTVYRTMFTAVVTAALGMGLLAALGVMDITDVTDGYPTWIWPFVAGGLLVGAGFVVSGYCPGTSVVAAASGKLDGAVTVLGVVLGTLLYAELEPALGGFQNVSAKGGLFLYDLLHVSPLTLAVVVAGVAVLTFKGAGLIERAVARARAAKAEAPSHP